MKLEKILPDFNPKLKRLQEMAIAGWGDWEGYAFGLSTISELIINKNYELIGTFVNGSEKYDMYRLNDSLSNIETIIVGYYILVDDSGKHRFQVIFECKISNVTIPSIKNLKNVDSVMVRKGHQGKRIATNAYKFIVKKLKYKLLGDETQYFGARKLWTVLSNDAGCIVDIIDISTGKYVERNVKLYHGSEDYEFDDRVWDYTDIKKNIRVILIDVK
jgi:hypothetical protein